MYTWFYDITIRQLLCSCVYVFLYIQISDAVDNGHNKKAIQIAEKILKKQGDLHCAKVGLERRRVINHVVRSGVWEEGYQDLESQFEGEDP